jgi:hypothetical protein
MKQARFSSGKQIRRPLIMLVNNLLINRPTTYSGLDVFNQRKT